MGFKNKDYPRHSQTLDQTLDQTLTPCESTHITDASSVSSQDGIASTTVAMTSTVSAVPSEVVYSPAELQESAQWSRSLQAMIDQPPASFPGRVLLGGLVFCGVFGAWAWFGQIQEVSHAQGKLVPQGEVFRVQPVTEGKVTRILVKEGQSVQKGQVIAELDNRLAAAEVERVQQSLEADRLQFNQLQSLMERTQLEAQTQQTITQSESRAQEASIVEIEATISTQRQTVELLKAERDAYQRRLTRLRPLVDEGVVAAEQLFEVEQSAMDRERSITQAQGDLQQAEAKAAGIQAGLVQRQAEEERSRLENQQKLQQLKLEANKLQAKMQETETLLKTARSQLDRMVLQSPVQGTISALNVNNVGEVIQLGQTVAEIAPKGAPLVLSSILPNREAGLVHPGMAVQIKFDAFPFQDYGTVAGKVVSISPDAKVDQQLGNVYRVEIKLDKNTVTHQQQTVALKAGQTAQAEIVVQKRRILDLIFDPFKKLQNNHLSL